MNKRLIFVITTILFIIVFILCFLRINRQKNFDINISKNPIRIVFITDNNYVLYMRTSIRSIIANKNPDTNIEIYVIGMNLYNNNINKILHEARKNVKISVIEISDKDINNLQADSKKTPGVSRADNAKFFISKILKDLDKVIYLDGDTIVLKDLSDFYNTELGNNYIGAVDDWQTGWKDNPAKRYFNNGVMLLNLKKIRKDDVENKMIDFKRNDKVKRFVTQDAFNNVMYGKVKFLPLIYDTFSPEFNNENLIERIKEVLKNNFDSEIYQYTTAEQYRQDVSIIHYCGYGNKKPWKKIDFTQKSNIKWYKYAPLDFWLDIIQRI